MSKAAHATLGHGAGPGTDRGAGHGNGQGDGLQAEESVRFALAALAAHGQQVGVSRSVPVRELACDLVTDLMHLADRSGWVFAEVLDAAAAAHRCDVREASGPVVLTLPARAVA